MSRVDIIELLDGRLYQWDTGRRVALHPLAGQTADEVHFSNNGKDALVVKPALEGSVLVASIPNILLQEAKNVAAYAVMVSDTGERTTYGRNLPVFPRAKPADYAYTETELADYKALEARVAALEKSGGGGGATVVDGAVVSSGSDYAICFEWHDGNPDKEDRRNRFVQLSDGGSKITFATSDADICGVTTDTAAFVENYDIASEHTSLCGILGVVTVIDNGTCTIGGTCMSDDNGYAIPSINNMGYRVMERLDENKIRIAVKPNDDMVQRIKRDMDNKVDFGKQQELSEDQKSQARENIDAASKKDISSLSSKIDSIPSGKDGADGQDGITPTIGDNGNWYLGDTDTGKPSRGEPGQDGSPGAAGADGYTPVKGTDYFTDADKQEIAEAAAGMVSIPDKLPNPNALTFTGAVEETYDGSEAKTVNIPSGGGGNGTMQETVLASGVVSAGTAKWHKEDTGLTVADLQEWTLWGYVFKSSSQSNNNGLFFGTDAAVYFSGTTKCKAIVSWFDDEHKAVHCVAAIAGDGMINLDNSFFKNGYQISSTANQKTTYGAYIPLVNNANDKVYFYTNDELTEDVSFKIVGLIK